MSASYLLFYTCLGGIASYKFKIADLGDENHGSHVRRVIIRINRHGWRQKRAMRIAALVSSACTWRSDMRRNALGSHLEPIAPYDIISLFGKFQLPKCCVNAHKTRCMNLLCFYQVFCRNASFFSAPCPGAQLDTQSPVTWPARWEPERRSLSHGIAICWRWESLSESKS